MSDDNVISVKPSELTVDIGLPCGPSVPWQTAMSLAKTVKACTERSIECGVACIAGSSVVTWARSKVLDTFLQGKASRLFWIDSDMAWEPASFLRLLVLSSKYDVICGAYSQKNESQNIVMWKKDLQTLELNPHGLIKFEGCGLGFTIMTREAAEKLAASKPQIYDPVSERCIADVFRIDTVPRESGPAAYRGEDAAFFADLIELGYDVHLDPTIKLGHVGSKEYRCDPAKSLGLDTVLCEVAT